MQIQLKVLVHYNADIMISISFAVFPGPYIAPVVCKHTENLCNDERNHVVNKPWFRYDPRRSQTSVRFGKIYTQENTKNRN